MKTAEEIIQALDICGKSGISNTCEGCPYIRVTGCQAEMKEDAKNLLQSLVNQDGEKSKVGLSYWSNITAINKRQEDKGVKKYGERLEDNTTLTNTQRIEHAQEEAIDLLKYLEHLKQISNDGITANDYQRAAMRTANDLMSQDGMLTNGVLGLCGETGEVADIVKKSTFQGHELEKEHIAEELGDVAWYLALTAHAIGYKLGYIFQKNVDKLKERYPDGFDKSRSINREDESNHESK